MSNSYTTREDRNLIESPARSDCSALDRSREWAWAFVKQSIESDTAHCTIKGRKLVESTDKQESWGRGTGCCKTGFYLCLRFNPPRMYVHPPEDRSIVHIKGLRCNSCTTFSLRFRLYNAMDSLPTCFKY